MRPTAAVPLALSGYAGSSPSSQEEPIKKPANESHTGQCKAVMGSGAYSFAMSSNYNTRPRAPEILVSGGTAHVIREREQLEDLWASERLPEHLV